MKRLPLLAVLVALTSTIPAQAQSRFFEGKTIVDEKALIESRRPHMLTGYNPFTDLAPICLLTVIPNVMMVSNSSTGNRYSENPRPCVESRCRFCSAR